MVFQGFINVVLNIIDWALSPLNGLNWVFSNFDLSPLRNFLSVIYYILPIENILPIFVFIVSMFAFRIVISLVKTIWDILPMV